MTEVEEQCSYNPVSPMASRRDRGGSLGLEVPLGTEEAMVEKGPVNDEYQTLLDPVVEKSTGEERMLPETLLGNGFSSVDSSGPSRLSEGKNGLAFDFSGLTVDRLGPVVEKVLLEGLACVPLRSESMGSRNPMCVSRSVLTQCCPDLSDLALCWLSSTILGLNSYWGGDLFCDAGASEIQSSYIRNLAGDVLRLCSIKAKVEHFDWCKFFSNRGVDYQGDEVKVAKSFVWRNISPALPAEVGRVRLEDVCTLGCRHYVQNFDFYLRPQEEWPVIKRPRVMVPDDSWGEVCEGLVKQGVCTFVHRDDVFDCGDGPLLNGLFGVTKDEWSEGFEVYRLIMNLIPLNSLCKGLAGDINTLPSWAGMNPFFMQPEESLLVSSEDVRCFFYILSVPQCWWKYLCFNKRVPDEVLPPELRGEEVYLGSKVLPMGFLNSVSLAQHVHRNLALQVEDSREGNSPEAELRKDRPFPTSNPLWRVYLDNFDLLEKVKATQVCDLEGSAAPAVLALRGQYEKWDVPRNLKKAVSRSLVAEVQGAIIDGEKGLAYPKEQKLVKYLSSALSLLGQTSVSQREMQVVCGGLVYVSMFRRPLLGTLNSVWKFIEAFESSMVKRLPLPAEVKFELGRFVAMVPMARIDFRLEMDPQVTCSDASCSGGGICASRGLTPMGVLASQGLARGDVPETSKDHRVLSVGLFDGIGALRVALDLLEVDVIGHVGVEVNESASRVVESHFPESLFIPRVEDVTKQVVQSWAGKFSQASIVILGAGPPCQGVSGLNADRLAALKDARSSLFSHVKRIELEVKVCFPWCAVYTLMESVASMDDTDLEAMSSSFGSYPWRIDAGGMLWCSRPRVYWLEWELFMEDGATMVKNNDNGAGPRSKAASGGCMPGGLD